MKVCVLVGFLIVCILLQVASKSTEDDVSMEKRASSTGRVRQSRFGTVNSQSRGTRRSSNSRSSNINSRFGVRLHTNNASDKTSPRNSHSNRFHRFSNVLHTSRESKESDRNRNRPVSRFSTANRGSTRTHSSRRVANSNRSSVQQRRNQNELHTNNATAGLVGNSLGIVSQLFGDLHRNSNANQNRRVPLNHFANENNGNNNQGRFRNNANENGSRGTKNERVRGRINGCQKCSRCNNKNNDNELRNNGNNGNGIGGRNGGNGNGNTNNGRRNNGNSNGNNNRRRNNDNDNGNNNGRRNNGNSNEINNGKRNNDIDNDNDYGCPEQPTNFGNGNGHRNGRGNGRRNSHRNSHGQSNSLLGGLSSFSNLFGGNTNGNPFNPFGGTGSPEHGNSFVRINVHENGIDNPNSNFPSSGGNKFANGNQALDNIDINQRRSEFRPTNGNRGAVGFPPSNSNRHNRANFARARPSRRHGKTNQVDYYEYEYGDDYEYEYVQPRRVRARVRTVRVLPRRRLVGRHRVRIARPVYDNYDDYGSRSQPCVYYPMGGENAVKAYKKCLDTMKNIGDGSFSQMDGCEYHPHGGKNALKAYVKCLGKMKEMHG